MAEAAKIAKPLTLMVVHAHPDDEAIGTGGILKKYSGQGIRTIVVFATKGEAGEINGRIPTVKEKEGVGELRVRELQCSCRILGVHQVHFLGYRDSGMAGTPENRLPGAFASADRGEGTRLLVHIIRKEKPHIITTYNEKGTYGHPDHIAVNQITVRAFDASGRTEYYPDPALRPWQPLKLYYQAIPLSHIRKMGEIMKNRARELDIDPESMGTEDEAITTWVDIRDVLNEKLSAIRCHKSQVGENSFFNQIPASQREEILGFECFIWVGGHSKPGRRETDLFEGIR